MKQCALNLIQYEDYLRQTKAQYDCWGFEVLDLTSLPSRFAILRHDVDISPQNALAMAKIEAKLGIRTTYTVLLTGEFYSPFEKSIKNTIREIHNLGHDIGLHFDAAWHGIESESELEASIRWETETLNRLLDLGNEGKVKMFSFHNTTRFTLACQETHYAGLRNAYAGILQSQVQYTSDSNGYWIFRSWDELLDEKHDRIQILTHPEWWGEEDAEPAEKVCRELQQRSVLAWVGYRELLESADRENRTGLTTRPDVLPGILDQDGDKLLMKWLNGERTEAFLALFRSFEQCLHDSIGCCIRRRFNISPKPVLHLLNHTPRFHLYDWLLASVPRNAPKIEEMSGDRYKQLVSVYSELLKHTNDEDTQDLGPIFDEILNTLRELKAWCEEGFRDVAMDEQSNVDPLGNNKSVVIEWMRLNAEKFGVNGKKIDDAIRMV